MKMMDDLLIKDFIEENYAAFQRFLGERNIDETEAEGIIDALEEKINGPSMIISGKW